MMIQKRLLPLRAWTKIHEQKLLTFYIGKPDQVTMKHVYLTFTSTFTVLSGLGSQTVMGGTLPLQLPR